MPYLLGFKQLSVAALLISCQILTTMSDTETKGQNVDPGDPLFLTPIIEGGELSKAMEAALVTEFFPIISYSGLITVHSTYNSNIFFWFFPAEGKQIVDNTAPVVLWSDGGPGISAIFSIFGQNGPFSGCCNGSDYTLNPHSWHKKYNMIYLDNPVEVGYSFTENENGYVTSAVEAARDVYEFLTQFFSMFPHLRRNQFYNGGTSYGATYAIQIANYIHQQNSASPNVFINLTGVILDSPWIDASTQVDYGDYLYTVGLVSESSRDQLREQQDEIKSLVDQGQYLEAFSAWKQTSQIDVMTLTGYGAMNDIYNDQSSFTDMTSFIVQNSTRKALHVGSLRFLFINPAQQERMHANFLRSSKPEMDTLLQAGYRFLVYVGNMDCSTGPLGTQKLIKSLSWSGAADLINGSRTIWKESGRVAGYNMTSSNATFLIVRNAGHGCLLQQPEWVFNAVVNFIGEMNDITS